MALLRSASRWSAARQRPNGYTRAGLVNLARDRWRARRCRHATASPATRPSHCRLPGDVTAAVPGQQLLPRARQPPPVQQRAVLVLRLWQDHSVNETAAAVRPWRPIRQAVRPPRPHVTFRDASSSWPWAPDPICAGMASWPLAAMRRTRRSAAAAVAHGAPAWSRSMVLSPCAFPAGIAGVAAGEERGDLLAAASRPVPWGSASHWRVAPRSIATTAATAAGMSVRGSMDRPAMPLLQQPPIIPVTGASSVAQLEELSGAAALRLDGAGDAWRPPWLGRRRLGRRGDDHPAVTPAAPR